MKLCKESWIILALGTADLIFTIYLIENGLAVEGNPLFAWVFSHGLLFFIAAKAFLMIGPVMIFEYALKSHPRFTKFALRFTIAAYIIMYVLGVIGINFIG